jgi:NADPH:quinone reductase-like Zn-dependent oxidoreductase
LPAAPQGGADDRFNYKTTPDWEKAALGLTGGRGVDHVVEVGGAATLARSFGAIRVGGKITMIGGLSGPATEINPGLIFARRANVQGISVGSMQMFEVSGIRTGSLGAGSVGVGVGLGTTTGLGIVSGISMGSEPG